MSNTFPKEIKGKTILIPPETYKTRAIAMTSPDHEPPPMVPSAKERVDAVYEAWNSPDSAPDIEALHERAMEQAYHDGWNAARAAQAERDQINFDEGRAFERGDAPPQYECPECGDTHLASFHAPPQPSEDDPMGLSVQWVDQILIAILSVATIIIAAVV